MTIRAKYTFRSNEELALEASKYKTKTEFRKANPNAHNVAHSRGIFDKICAHMPKHIDMSGENNPFFKWTIEDLLQVALKYKGRKEFEINDNTVYSIAQKRGLLEQICKHMGQSKREPWKREEILKESLKYNTRGDFFKYNCAAYGAARTMGILELACVHMKISCGTSIPEIELIEIIKQKYISSKKIRDMKVKIPNKAHIKGFEIDIFIPELNKGIEFDGTWHHSVKGLEWSRPNWPKKDIHNFHKIKDKYFASKGIQILHIKEKDWLANKEECIKRCFEFLG